MTPEEIERQRSAYIERERVAFEKWAAQSSRDFRRGFRDTDRYTNSWTNTAWDAWLARAQSEKREDRDA